MRRHYWIAVSVLAVAVVAAGSAVAATKLASPSSRSNAIINDAAGRLHVSPGALSSALEQALDDQVDTAVAAGRLTKAQGDALKAQINAGKVPLVGGLPFAYGFGPRGFAAPRLHFGFPARPGGLLTAGLHVVTSYLGITQAQLRSELVAGKSLAQVATDHGKTADGLVTALMSAAKSRLDEAVAAKQLRSEQESAILAKIRPFLENLVNHTPPALGHMRPGLGLGFGFGFGMGLLHRGRFGMLPRSMRPLRQFPGAGPRI